MNLCAWLLRKTGSIFGQEQKNELSAELIAAFKEQIKLRWGEQTSDFLYPLAKKTDQSFRVFDPQVFFAKFSEEDLQSMLDNLGVDVLYEFTEDNGCRRLNVNMWQANYGVGENYAFTDRLDWIFYFSHEHTITVGGRLADEVLRQWPEATEFQQWLHK